MGKRAILRKEIRQLRRDLRASDLRSVDLRFLAVDRSTDLATAELRGRLAILNELRGDVVSRGEFTTKIGAIETLIETRFGTLDKALDEVKERQTLSSGGGRALDKAWGYVVGVLGLGALAVDLLLRATGH